MILKISVSGTIFFFSDIGSRGGIKFDKQTGQIVLIFKNAKNSIENKIIINPVLPVDLIPRRHDMNCFFVNQESYTLGKKNFAEYDEIFYPTIDGDTSYKGWELLIHTSTLNEQEMSLREAVKQSMVFIFSDFIVMNKIRNFSKLINIFVYLLVILKFLSYHDKNELQGFDVEFDYVIANNKIKIKWNQIGKEIIKIIYNILKREMLKKHFVQMFFDNIIGIVVFFISLIIPPLLLWVFFNE